MGRVVDNANGRSSESRGNHYSSGLDRLKKVGPSTVSNVALYKYVPFVATSDDRMFRTCNCSKPLRKRCVTGDVVGARIEQL